MNTIILNEKIAAAQITKRLTIHGQSLKEFPIEIFELKDLEYLDLFNNDIENVPEEIGTLKKLTVLDLRDNKIKSIPTTIGLLKELQYLSLINNQISDLPEELGDLSSLESFYIQKNFLSNFPENFFNLKRLKILNISDNLFKEIPEKISLLSNLTNLYLDNNSIRLFSPSIRSMGNIQKLSLTGNPIGPLPIELESGNVSSIINFYSRLSEKEELYEAKLIVVGQGEAGKSTLIHRLINNDFNSQISRTHGIEVSPWFIKAENGEDFKINIWDFGGQEIYHATHQFFLTKRSLYVLVWEAAKDEDLMIFEYWLNVIKLIGNDSPVIVVQNKVDDVRKHIDEKSLQEKFDNIKCFHKVSAKEGDGIEQLREDISKWITSLPHVGEPLPKVWLEIRKILEDSPQNFIEFEEFESVCTLHGLDKSESLTLCSYFHDLGVFLNFQDNSILKTTVFLKPEWATKSVYAITDDKIIHGNFGKFDFSQLRNVWKDYPENKYLHLLQLMYKFELCFDIPNTTSYIIPELANPEAPYFSWNYENNLRREYIYDFIPKGVMTRFIVRNNNIIFNNISWKNGVILERKTYTIEKVRKEIIKHKYTAKDETEIEVDEEKQIFQIPRTITRALIINRSKNISVYVKSESKLNSSEYNFYQRKKKICDEKIAKLDVEKRLEFSVYMNTLSQLKKESRDLGNIIQIENESRIEEARLLDQIKYEIEYINTTVNNPICTEKIPCQCEDCLDKPVPHFFEYLKVQEAVSKDIPIQCGISLEMISPGKLLSNFTHSTVEQIPINIETNSINFNNISQMKINKINSPNSTLTFIEKLESNQINDDKMDLIIDLLKSMNERDLQRLNSGLKEYQVNESEETKQGLYSLIKDHLLPLGHNVTASAIFEIIKTLTTLV